MSIVYKDIDTYTPKSSVAGTEKIPVSSSEYITPNQITAALTRGNAKLFYGTCDTAAGTAEKVVVCPDFTLADLAPGTVILVKFSNANSASVSEISLNINNTGANRILKVQNDAADTLTYAGEIRGITHMFVFSRTSVDRWYLVGGDVNTNTTYSNMTQAELDAGTGTTGRRITPELLRDNFYTETEVNTLMGGKKIWAGTQAQYDLLTPDSDTLYFITESSS